MCKYITTKKSEAVLACKYLKIHPAEVSRIIASTDTKDKSADPM